jgi:hypothetical protein
MNENNDNITDDEKNRIMVEICNQVNFKIQVGDALKDNNQIMIEKLMHPQNHSSLNKRQKEKEILDMALELLFFREIEESCLEFLVFDYKISEDTYTEMGNQYKNKIVENMFDKRRLNEELSTELASNFNSKLKLKV